jgi:apolipoprotein N-acyltransferase
LGQNAWVSAFAPLAAAAGYALFWQWIQAFPSGKSRPLYRFLLAVAWFSLVQALQLSWMSSTCYMGPCILIVYVLLSIGMGVQFGILSWLIGRWMAVHPQLRVSRALWVDLLCCAGLAGIWTIFEWLRLWVLTGFTWNPAGMALAAQTLSLQMASLFGVYGLSFWVIFVNLTGFCALITPSRRRWAVWAACAIVPYFFGWIHLMTAPYSERSVSAVLVQTSLMPEQKEFDPQLADQFIDPLNQWDHILGLVQQAGWQKGDLIILPEGALPFEAYRPVYPLSAAEKVWHKYFTAIFPPSGAIDFRALPRSAGKEWNISNVFWMQALANHCQCEIIAGMNDRDTHGSYNAAFHFFPGRCKAWRYEKRVLVPMGEYVPFAESGWFSRWLIKEFSLGDSFQPGKAPKICSGQINLGVSICYEETYSELIRSLRNMGAQLLINISNDAWFPDSRLPRQHFNHGVIRAVENGLPEIRVCNTGVTGAVDCFGRVIAKCAEGQAGSTRIEIPLATVSTLYSRTGDAAILTISCVCAAFFLTVLFWRKRRIACSK